MGITDYIKLHKMKKIKTVIIDDDKLTIKLIAKLLENHDDIELLETYTDPLKAIDEINKHQPDLLFLDIEMPKMNGVDLIKKLAFKANFIFVSAFDAYAIEGFNLDAIDFVLKPIEEDRFNVALEKVRHNISNNVKNESGEGFMFIKEKGQHHKIAISDIVVVKSDTDYLHIITEDNKRFVILHTLKEMQDKLYKYGIIKVHKSYLVDKSRVLNVDSTTNELDLGSMKVPFSRRMKKSMLEELNIKKKKQ